MWPRLAHITRFVRAQTALVLLVVSTSGSAQPLSEPLGSAEVAAYAKWLALSAEQRVIVESAHQDYLNDRESCLPQIQRFYDDERIAIIVVNESENPATAAEEVYEELQREREQLQATLDALDEALFDTIESILTEEQLRFMQRVRLSRLRERYRPRDYHHVLPEARPDLILTLESLALSEDVYRKGLSEVLLEFEPVYVEAMRADAMSRMRRDMDRWRERALQDACKASTSEWEQLQLTNEFFEAKAAAGRRRVAAAEHLRVVTLRGMGEIVEVLPPDDARRFVAECVAISFPAIYPDPASAEALYDAVLAMNPLAPEISQTLHGMREQFLLRHEHLSSLMAENRALSSSIGMLAAPDYRERMLSLDQDFRDLGEQRYQLCAQQIDRVRAAVPMERHASLPEWDFDTHPRRRPWDSEADWEWKTNQERVRQEKAAGNADEAEK